MKLHHSFFLKALSLTILAGFPMKANALLPYKYNWTKIKSDHFTIIVNKNYSTYGKLIAQKAEQAFTALKKFSNKHPQNTFIIIDHTKGFSNGSATFFPYPVITLQPVIPDSSLAIGQYKDWIYELLVHEYTHILTFHNTKGLFTPLRWIFGSTISPGYFMPTWYQEGLAIFTETHLSNGGRLRTASYKALKDELKSLSISIANESSSGVYPFGLTPYVYGGWLNQESFSNIKDAAKAHKKFSGRFPYLINGGYKKSSGKNLYSSWKLLFGANKKVTSLKHTFIGRLPKWDKTTNSLYFIKKDAYLFDELTVQNKKNKPKTLFTAHNILDFKVHKENIYYLSLNLQNQDHQIYSLFSFNLKTKKITRLSKKQNIQSFDIFENGSIAFIDAKINTQSLYFGVLTKLNKATQIFIVSAEKRLSFPRIKNNSTILFALKKNHSKETVISININTLNQTPLFSVDHLIGLERNKDTFYALHESKGIKYLQNINLNKSTQVHSGITSLNFKDDNHIFSSRILSKGPHILSSDLNSLKSNEKPIKILNQSKPSTLIKKSDLKHSLYSSFSKLNPHYIIPNVLVSPYGFSEEFLYSINIGSQDPLKFNSYSLNISTDTITKKASTNINYTSHHFRLPISFSAGLFNKPLSLNLFKKSTFATLGTAYTLKSGFGKKLDLFLSTLWNLTNFKANEKINRLGLSLNLFYNNSVLRSRELSPRKGYNLNLELKHYLPGTTYFNYTQASLNLKLFTASPFIKTHRLIFGFNFKINNKTLPFIFSSNSLNQPYRYTSPGSFALRGLPTGALFATDSFAITHFEYRLPILSINWGPGLLPCFLNRITGALTADYGSAKGASFINKRLINHSIPLYSAGGELIFEGKLFYHLPISLQIGAYKFLNSDIYSGPPELFIGFNLNQSS